MSAVPNAAGPAILEDDEPVLELAARGDRAAQSLMMDHSIACANAGHIPLSVALGAAEVFARMAVYDGAAVNRRRLAGVLLWQAENLWNCGYYERSRIYQLEAIGIVNALADAGDERAAALLSQYAHAFSPDILKLAAELARGGEDAPDADPRPLGAH